MRYRIGEEINPEAPYAESMHAALSFSYWLAIPIGLILVWMGIKGRILWLKVWGGGLSMLSVVLLGYENFGNG